MGNFKTQMLGESFTMGCTLTQWASWPLCASRDEVGMVCVCVRVEQPLLNLCLALTALQTTVANKLLHVCMAMGIPAVVKPVAYTRHLYHELWPLATLL